MTVTPTLAVSQIAWHASEEIEVANLMADMGINAIELAPSRLFENPGKPRADEIRKCRDFWGVRGIRPVAFQALLYGKPELTLFESAAAREAMIAYISQQILAAGALGVHALIFGSPRNRSIPRDMTAAIANEIAVDTFRRIADVANDSGVILCVEPNPVEYGCNFITTAAHGIDMVREVDSAGFGLHLDTAGMWLAGDDFRESVQDAADWLEHFHVSAPNLGLVGLNELPYEVALRALSDANYAHTVSIEMRAGNSNNLARVKSAVHFLQSLSDG